MKKTIVFLIILLLAFSCRISYRFNGASIDYSIIKTMEIRDFPNQAVMQYPALPQVFTETLRDHFTKNTRLEFTNVNPDLELEGEIVRYDLTPQAIKEDAYASMTRLTMSVRFRFRNNKNPQEDREETVTAHTDFSADIMFTEVQDQLIDELSRDIADQIFNITLSNW